MAPEIHFEGRNLQEEDIKGLLGKPAKGYLHWEDDHKNSLESLRDQVEELLTANDPKGFIRSVRGIKEWEKLRYSEESVRQTSLAWAFPERPHRIYTTILNDLKRAGIHNIRDLVERKDFGKIRKIGYEGNKYQALKLIVDYFS
ncbi:MAG: hypothetical protein V1858_04430 [Candidatus Gottesmanbacteria bacterium]